MTCDRCKAQGRHHVFNYAALHVRRVSLLAFLLECCCVHVASQLRYCVWKATPLHVCMAITAGTAANMLAAETGTQTNAATDAHSKQKRPFPLCCLLLRYVYTGARPTPDVPHELSTRQVSTKQQTRRSEARSTDCMQGRNNNRVSSWQPTFGSCIHTALRQMRS
jgi:hypothetical protein